MLNITPSFSNVFIKAGNELLASFIYLSDSIIAAELSAVCRLCIQIPNGGMGNIRYGINKQEAGLSDRPPV